jgi:Kef-type K+ transport system membrane component KefB
MEHVDITNLIVVTTVGMAAAACIPAPRLPVPGVVLEIVIGAVIGHKFLARSTPGR